MTKYNFIRVITFISVFLLIFATSVHDPSVQAKMRAMEDDALSNVTGAAVEVVFNNVTVRSVASGGLRYDNGEASSDYINIGYLDLGNGTAGGNFILNTSMGWDIGFGNASGVSQTWLTMANVNLPSSAGIGLIANDISYRVNGGTPQIIGNLIVSGLYLGRNVTGITAPNIVPGSNVFLVISSSKASGIEGWLDMGAYLDKLTYNWNTALDNFTASGIYVIGMLANGTADGNPANWNNPLTGSMKLGGVFPTWNSDGSTNATTVTTYAEANVGTAAGAGANLNSVQLNLPLMGSIRIRDLTFGGTDWGPIALDGAVFYKQLLTFRALNASGY